MNELENMMGGGSNMIATDTETVSQADVSEAQALTGDELKKGHTKFRRRTPMRFGHLKPQTPPNVATVPKISHNDA